MSQQQALLGDAWIREAQEASRLIEEIESRIKDQNPGQSLRDSARRKLLELGPKLDRLESLLHNPPAKPILTDQDLDLRQNMLSELQLRTRAMARSLYRIQLPRSPGSLPEKAIEDPAKTISSYGQDDRMTQFSKQEHELLVSLVKDDASRSLLQRRQTISLVWKRWIWNVCRVIFLVLAAAALLFILVIVCAAI